MRFTFCSWGRLFSSYDDIKMCWTGAVLGTLATFSEPGHRREEMCLFMMPRTMTAFWKYVTNRMVNPPDVPGFKVFLFVITMAAIAYAHEHEQDTMKPIVKTFSKYALQ